jgi:VHL beta domain
VECCTLRQGCALQLPAAVTAIATLRLLHPTSCISVLFRGSCRFIGLIYMAEVNGVNGGNPAPDVGDSSSAEPVQQDPPTASWSDASTTSTRMQVVNRSSRSIQCVWLGYDGSEQVYNVLEPGKDVFQGMHNQQLALKLAHQTQSPGSTQWACLLRGLKSYPMMPCFDMLVAS